jgi:hypothetical protein
LKDRHTKFQIYESQKIPYYIIVSPDAEEVEVYEFQNDAYKLSSKGKNSSFSFSFEKDCFATIDFGEIWK